MNDHTPSTHQSKSEKEVVRNVSIEIVGPFLLALKSAELHGAGIAPRVSCVGLLCGIAAFFLLSRAFHFSRWPAVFSGMGVAVGIAVVSTTIESFIQKRYERKNKPGWVETAGSLFDEMYPPSHPERKLALGALIGHQSLDISTAKEGVQLLVAELGRRRPDDFATVECECGASFTAVANSPRSARSCPECGRKLLRRRSRPMW